MADLVGLFLSTTPGTDLLDRLNERISKPKRYKKRPKVAIRPVYTPIESVCLVLKLEIPKKPYRLLLCLFFA